MLHPSELCTKGMFSSTWCSATLCFLPTELGCRQHVAEEDEDGGVGSGQASGGSEGLSGAEDKREGKIPLSLVASLLASRD